MGNWAVAVVHISTARARITLIEVGLLSKVNLCGCQIVQRLMDPPVIVEVEILGQVLPDFLGIGVVMQIDFFVLHGPPEALGEDVVQCPAFAIHADLHLGLLQPFNVLRAGEVAALITIPNGGGRLRNVSIGFGHRNREFSVETLGLG